jgi:hypothetical protein
LEAIHAGGVALCFSFLAVTGDCDQVTLCQLVGGGDGLPKLGDLLRRKSLYSPFRF